MTFKSPECRAGRYVTAGTLLVEIDPRNYRLEVNRLEEEVKQAEAVLRELDVEIENSGTLLALAEEQGVLRQKELQRYTSLLGQNATSELNVDDARRQELAARNNVAQLRNQLRMQEATRDRLSSARELSATRLEQATLNLEKSQVRASIDGVIVNEAVEENNFVRIGTALLTVEDTSAAEVRCSLRMEELDWVWRQAKTGSTVVSVGEPDTTAPPAGNPPSNDLSDDYHLPPTPVTVTYRLGEREYHWEGVLWRYEGIGLDEATRTVPCRVLVSKPREMAATQAGSSPSVGGLRALVRGMFVRVTVHAQPESPLLRFPERAVQPGNIVWCVRDGLLHVMPLHNITLQGDTVLVAETAEGLHRSDVVVTTPLPVATHGMQVQLQNRSTAMGDLAVTGIDGDDRR